MRPDRGWLTLDGVDAREEEFYWLWILATTAYGVGDVVTTIALVYYDPRVAEANPLVAAAMGSFGLGGLVVLKWAVFGCSLALSVVALRAWRDRFLYYAPPLTLTAVGLLVTASNLWLLAR